MRDTFRALGCTISEFPLNDPTAIAASRHGDLIVLGAPNVVRGGSHNGGIDAATMVRHGRCDVLASDYYYPSQLQSAFRLVRDRVAPLAEAWALVSSTPAVAAGLNDRGAIAPGRRADLVIVDDGVAGMPRVVATFAGGRPIFVDGSLARLAA
jgi:alpha-D-ribose 1-methylphosphonate 5-triphosphate diphosphatase